MEVLSEIEAICNEISQREGCRVYDVEMTGNAGHRILRVYIDSEDGIGIEQCTNVSRALNLRLDVEDVVPGGTYNLEVSSPGLERKLRRIEHYHQAIGSEVLLKTKRALVEYGLENGSKKKTKQCRAQLMEVKTDETRSELLVCKVGENQLEIPLADINRANIFFDFEKSKKKGSTQ